MTRNPQRRIPKIKLFRFTKEGKWFVLLLLGVGFAALNTANNLLYLVFSLKVCLLFSQILLGELNIKKISLRRSAQHRATADEAFPVTLHITCLNRRFPNFSVQVRDVIDGVPFKRSGHFLKTNAGETRHIEYKCECPHRGHTHFDGILISSAFPFGLTERARLVTDHHDMIIWPSKLPVRMPSEFGSLRSGNRPISRKGNSEDFWQLREFRTGDDARRISWKASARQRRLILLETAAHTDEYVEMALDLDSATSPGEKETLIRIAASVVDLLHHQKIPVTFYAADGVAIACETDACNAILDYLALLKTSENYEKFPVSYPPGIVRITSANAAIFLHRSSQSSDASKDGESSPSQVEADHFGGAI